MPSLLRALALDSHDPARLATFWGGILGREVSDEARGPLLPGSDTQVGLRFVPSRSEKLGPNRVHLHLTSSTTSGQLQTVAAALDLGATHLDVGQLPEEEHIVLADPEGNELCVIEAGNGFLAGCGLLGELACDGTREVGVFWSEALAWPLVWDQDQETAVQSPYGGTKVAWGGRRSSRSMGGTGSASSSPRSTPTWRRRPDDWCRWARPGWTASRTAPSSWPTRTATSSR